jgi:hypothetical protein|tara:strand:- start:106 stop:690 length:585 start_codon:yes stop_codon:yes gene_type:complete
MSSQFAGLPMSDLIGGPLQAACDAQVLMANATVKFITDIGLTTDADGGMTANTVDFGFSRPAQSATTGDVTTEQVDLQVPLLAIVNTPNLAVKEVDIDFTMSVASSTSSANTTDASATMKASEKFNCGIFSTTVDISGSVASHSENTRASDNSAKYDVKVIARDDGPPEGLMKVLDMLQAAIAPVSQPAAAPTT